MTSEHAAILAYTVSHFQEVARQNRFPENAAVDHDTVRCAICHPELLPLEPFAIYLQVVTQSIKVRRPHLDQGLVDEINNDLTLMALPARVTIESLRRGEPDSVQHWRSWLRDAISTGLGLLSIHSATSHEFDIDEAEAGGSGPLIDLKVDELIDFQRQCTAC
jgi:hypothetical protein